jgi:predicted amidohydrolase/ribosomal protein S18 acetylase RimI-like enzyme
LDDAQPKLTIRNARLDDIRRVIALCRRAYPAMEPYSTAQLRGQIQNFPAGQFVAVYEDKVIGYCATFRVAESLALAQHSWAEITGAGFASRHQPRGAWLYGMEVCVDPNYRGLRVGQRLYNERKRLCARLNLKGIVFGGRLPGLARRWRQVGSAAAYVEDVAARRLRDPVLGFQLRNGFEVVGVLENYLPWDKESRGYAAHLVWRNPKYAPPPSAAEGKAGRHPGDSVRIAIVQYQQRRVVSFEEFGRNVEYFVDVVADYRADFVVFPELFTLQLLSIENEQVPASEAIAQLTRYTEPLKALLSDLAVRYNINIIGGSHPTRDGNAILNISYVCLRDGAIHQQAKIHPTPNERYWWQIQGGEGLATIETDCGPIGVLICYDCEFPELARHLIDQGAQILFVPFCTDERQSYLRVRYCAHARAVENQCYVAMAGNVGNLPNVENMDIQYAQSCILTPCDFPFARDGIAADTTPNAEMVAFADLRLDALAEARAAGTVQNLNDRRFDLYSVRWQASAE